MGGYLRRLGILKTNLTVPVAFTMPGFYHLEQIFLKKCELEGEGADMLTSYKRLLPFVQGREPTCPVRGLAVGQAVRIWKEVAHPDLLNQHRDLAWQVAHGVLPVRGVMHARGMSAISGCPRCNKEERVRHLLWDCEVAQALWKEVYPLLRLLDKRIKLDCQLVQYGTGHRLGSAAWTLIWQVINCAKEAMWKARRLLVLEEKLLLTEQIKRVAWAAVKENMFRDSRRRGQEGARRAWGRAAWTMVMGQGGSACSGPGLPV